MVNFVRYVAVVTWISRRMTTSRRKRPCILQLSRYIRLHPFNGPFSGTTQVSRYQKGKTIRILLKQEAVTGSGISWAVCKSAPRSRLITRLAPHHSVFLQAGCPSCHPTNSVKALKAQFYSCHGNVRELTKKQKCQENVMESCLWKCRGKLFWRAL